MKCIMRLHIFAIALVAVQWAIAHPWEFNFEMEIRPGPTECDKFLVDGNNAAVDVKHRPNKGG